jgi:poly(A)-specific ribonuclease
MTAYSNIYLILGLQSTRSNDYFILDEIGQRYEKLRDSAENFAFLQLGLCLYKKSADNSKLISYPFSFYLLSEPSALLKLEKRVMFQASSAAFLAQNNFDFNKVFYKGIPFLSRAEEKLFCEKRGLSLNTRSYEDKTLTLTPENQIFVDEKM